MTDGAEQFVLDVQDALTTMLAPIPPVEAVFGALKKNEHRDAPLVNWWLEPLTLEDIEATDTEPAIVIDQQKLGLRIWHTSIENVRATLHNILAAARAAGYGPKLRFPDRFEWSEQGNNTAAHLKRYYSIQGIVDLRMPVSADPQGVTEVVIETINYFVSSNGELQVAAVLPTASVPVIPSAFGSGFDSGFE
jgi:hypothetical protein